MSKPVIVRFLGEDKDLKRAFNDTAKSAGMWAGATTLAGGAVGAAVGTAARATMQLAKDSVMAYSAYSEASSKAATVFGESFGQIEKIAEDGAQAMGLSKSAVMDYAGSFGNLFSQLGIASSKSVDMSKNILQLAADFGSFNNADITEVLNAQSAAFRGEYDALQRFLPLVSAATVEQKAMEMSGKANAEAVTAQEKALAVYQLMLEGAGAAQGDFARTSEGLANQQRILKAELENTKISIGNILQNEFLPGLIEGFGDADGKGRSAAETLVTIREKIEASGPAVRKFAEDVGELAAAIWSVINAIKEAIGWLDRYIGKASTANDWAVKAANFFLPKGKEFETSADRKPGGKSFIGPVPKRAAGGPMIAGQAYLINDGVEEVFTPGTSGHMTPVNRLGGPGSGDRIVLNVITMDEIEAQMVNRLQRRGLRGA